MLESLSMKDNGQIKREEGFFLLFGNFASVHKRLLISDGATAPLKLTTTTFQKTPHLHMFGRFVSCISMLATFFESKSELSGASLSSADRNKGIETWLITPAFAGAL